MLSPCSRILNIDVSSQEERLIIALNKNRCLAMVMISASL